MKENLTFEKAFTTFILSALLAIPLCFYSGWVFSNLWRWFIAPPLNVPRLSIWQSAGVMLLFNWTTLGLYREDKTALTRIFITLFGGLVLLGFGWLFSQWA